MSAIEDLPPLREIVGKFGLGARKSFGQNYLMDLNLTAKIARSAGPIEGWDVLEIGPGPGGLTRSLIAEGARKVVAVEKDARFLEPLREIAEASSGRLEIEIADGVGFDPEGRLGPPTAIVANLPFNRATELLARWVRPPFWPPFWNSMTLMFQSEVARRIVARPGTGFYGRLSVLAQWRTDARIVFEVPSRAFVPSPAVDAAVVRFDRRDEPVAPAEEEMLFRIVGKAFGQRRKMLRTSLKPLLPECEDTIRAAGLNPESRAAEIPIEGYCALAREAREA